MSAPPTPLPDLTPDDATRLDALIAANLCLFTLSTTTNTALRDLILWADSPSITPWLARLRNIRVRQLRQEMLDHLQSLVRTSPDPIESRRAASAVLKHLTPARPRERAAPARANNPTPHHPPHASQPPIPAPTLTPDPALTPRDVNNHLISTLIKPDLALAAATLAAFAAPSATIDHAPLIPTNHPDRPRAILAANHPALTRLSTATCAWAVGSLTITEDPAAAARTATFPVGITLADKSNQRLTLTLQSRKDTTPPDTWRLTALTLTPHVRPSG